MGGCRCSYRDCSVRSDGKTHMFHFPVFDKVRCHQWITNAQKTEFLNLKLSQLKNRVVCQHHFKDDCFMNEMKARLKMGAAPTEDGPYCATKNKNIEKVLPINIDDIENDVLCHNEKKAHMSVKYSDFLTNDIDLQSQSVAPIIIDNYDKYDAKIDYNVNKLSPRNKFNSKLRQKPEILPIDLEELINPLLTKVTDGNVTSEINIQNNNNNDQIVPRYVKNVEQKKGNISNDRRIKIISHKKISGPLKIDGKLEPVSPSTIIELPKKKRITNDPSNSKSQSYIKVEVCPIECDKNNTAVPSQKPIQYNQQSAVTNTPLFNEIPGNNENIYQSFNLEPESQAAMNPPIDQSNIEKNNVVYLDFQPSPNVTLNTNQTNITQQPYPERTHSSKSLLKSKLPPEKQAEIEEKRKYNMKVTDILDSCFKKCDEEALNVGISKILEDKQKVNKTPGTPQVPISNIKSPKKNSFAYIEEQLRQMENNLLAKIEQNTQKIMEIKHTVKPEVKKRTISTQTKEASDEVRKKQLFVEISKYLTPDANSLIYEELFINQYVEPSEKKRKVR